MRCAENSHLRPSPNTLCQRGAWRGRWLCCYSTGTAKAVKLQVCSMPAALSQGDLPYNIRAGSSCSPLSPSVLSNQSAWRRCLSFRTFPNHKCGPFHSCDDVAAQRPLVALPCPCCEIRNPLPVSHNDSNGNGKRENFFSPSSPNTSLRSVWRRCVACTFTAS